MKNLDFTKQSMHKCLLRRQLQLAHACNFMSVQRVNKKRGDKDKNKK
jgi:hypothetical protein